MIEFRIESVDYLENPVVFEKNYELVPLWRKKKIDSYKFSKDKNLSLGAWILLQKMLIENQIFKDEKSIPQVEFTENGKPFFVNTNPDTEIFFNLSHSGKNVICSISNKPVGCDIEEMVLSKSECLELAQQFFNKSEKDIILDLQEEKAVLEFYRLWTRKEAYCKFMDIPLEEILNQNIDNLINSQTLYEYKGNKNGYIFSVITKI